MRQVHADEEMHRGRVRIEIDGVTVAMGSLSNAICIGDALSEPDALIFLHPDDFASYSEWLKRNIN